MNENRFDKLFFRITDIGIHERLELIEVDVLQLFNRHSFLVVGMIGDALHVILDQGELFGRGFVKRRFADAFEDRLDLLEVTVGMNLDDVPDHNAEAFCGERGNDGRFAETHICTAIAGLDEVLEGLKLGCVGGIDGLHGCRSNRSRPVE